MGCVLGQTVGQPVRGRLSLQPPVRVTPVRPGSTDRRRVGELLSPVPSGACPERRFLLIDTFFGPVTDGPDSVRPPMTPKTTDSIPGLVVLESPVLLETPMCTVRVGLGPFWTVPLGV